MGDDPIIFPPADVLDRLVFTADLGRDEAKCSEAFAKAKG